VARSQKAFVHCAAFAGAAGWGVEYWHCDSGWNSGSMTGVGGSVWRLCTCVRRAPQSAAWALGHSWSGLQTSSTRKRWVVKWLGRNQYQNVRYWQTIFSNVVPRGEGKASLCERANASGRSRRRMAAGWAIAANTMTCTSRVFVKRVAEMRRHVKC